MLFCCMFCIILASKMIYIYKALDICIHNHFFTSSKSFAWFMRKHKSLPVELGKNTNLCQFKTNSMVKIGFMGFISVKTVLFAKCMEFLVKVWSYANILVKKKQIQFIAAKTCDNKWGAIFLLAIDGSICLNIMPLTSLSHPGLFSLSKLSNG